MVDPRRPVDQPTRQVRRRPARERRSLGSFGIDLELRLGADQPRWPSKRPKRAAKTARVRLESGWYFDAADQLAPTAPSTDAARCSSARPKRRSLGSFVIRPEFHMVRTRRVPVRARSRGDEAPAARGGIPVVTQDWSCQMAETRPWRSTHGNRDEAARARLIPDPRWSDRQGTPTRPLPHQGGGRPRRQSYPPPSRGRVRVGGET